MVKTSMMAVISSHHSGVDAICSKWDSQK